MIESLAEIAVRVYEHLKDLPEVVYPGSVRSYIAAVKDAYMRLLLEDHLSPEKIIEIVSRTIYQNISASIVLENKVDVFEEIKNTVIKALVVSSTEHKPLENFNSKTLILFREQEETEQESSKVLVVDRSESSLPSLKEAPLILTQESLTKSLEDSSFSIKRLKRKESFQTNIVSRKTFTSIFEKAHPQYLREYDLSASAFDIDLTKTAINISRKRLFGRKFSHRDIIVKEFSSTDIKNTILCLDVSGSMRELEGEVPKIELAKRAAINYLKYLAHVRGKISFIAFNYKAETLFIFEDTRLKINKIESIISKLWACGGTNMYAALLKARSLQKLAPGRVHVIVVSDGKTVFKKKCLREARYLRKRGAVVSSIVVGSKSNEDFMLKISKIGGGVFHRLKSYKKLDKALIETESYLRKFYI